MSLPLFAFFAALAVFSALGMIFQRNPVHALLSFALTLLDIGLLFMGLGAVTVGFSLASLARLLFTDYLVAFEVTSVLLLAAVVGAIGLARRLPASSVRVTNHEHENFRSAAG
jgi:NADH:ubiquinone oxidoreductase subunit 6 (subunit J)